MAAGAGEKVSRTECGIRVTFERQARVGHVHGRQIHIPFVVHLTEEKSKSLRARLMASLALR